jgi:hypothetical protein
LEHVDVSTIEVLEREQQRRVHRPADSGEEVTMSPRLTTPFFHLAAAAVALVLSACSGGGGDAVKTATLVNPEPSYRGTTTQAAVSGTNAEALALGGFTGTKIGGAIRTARTAGTLTRGDALVPQLAVAIKKSVRRMGLPGIARQRLQARQPSRGAAAPARVATHQVNGDGGGYASFTLDVNDATGSFSGSVDFHDYSSKGLVIAGNSAILGTFDMNTQEFSRLTLSFNALSMHSTGIDVTLIGSLSWGFNLPTSSENLTMNMILLDRSDSKTYWFRNYEIATVYNNGFLTQNFSGRYYDPDHGYVDITTMNLLVADYGKTWPTSGSLRLSGRLGSQVSITFSPYKLAMAADTDGNGTADWQAEKVTNDQPATNSPPTAEAGPDRDVMQGATVSLDGSTSSDPDTDPLSYAWSFQSCPQNICPSLGGSNSGTPSFVAERAGDYTLRLIVYDGEAASAADTVTVTSNPVAPSDPAFMQMQWQYGIYGTYIGRAGLLLSDLDGDGTPEIIASGSDGGSASSFWYVLKRNAGGTYDQLWRSGNYPGGITRIVLADLTGDGRDDIVVGLADGTIRIYDGATLGEAGKMTVAPGLVDMAVGDLDGDGNPEIVTSNGTGISVYSGQSGSLKWSLATGGGTSIAVGNVDGDSALEIVTTSYGGKGFVIDGVSHVVEWEYLNSFGAQVRLGDLDGDGMQEIVGASAWQKITVFDADRKTPSWELPTSLDIGALAVTDVDGDGIPEIVYGDGQWGKIHAIDATTRTQKWAVSNPEHGVSGIALGDVDLDGKKEVLWGAGGTSSGPDYLYVADPSTGTIKWQSLDINGPLSAVAVGDVDDDGRDDIVMVSRESDSGYAEGIVHIFDARTRVLKYSGKLGIRDLMGARSVRIADVDGDGKTEYIVTTGNLYTGMIRVYDGKTHALKCQSPGYDGNYFTALAVADVDNDGKVEIVAGQGREGTGAQGVYLVVFDGATLQEKWRSIDLGTYWGEVRDVKVADVNGDGHPDIVASVGGAQLYVFDGVNHDMKLLVAEPAQALEIADVDGDGAAEILVGRSDGKIDVFDGKTFALRKTLPTFGTEPIDALRVVDIDGDGIREWLLTRGGALVVLDGATQGLKWRKSLNQNLGAYNHLAVRDVDGDGRKDIFVGDSSSLYQFE